MSESPAVPPSPVEHPRPRSGARSRRAPGAALTGPVLALLGAVLALLAALPAGLAAQAVRGRMLEAGTGIPVPGALIELRAGADSTVDRVLTDEGGRFTVRAPAAGTYVLHAERIGFRDWDSDPFRVSAGEPATRIIQVATQPVSVAALSVQAERKCRLAREQGIATALLWAEVKKGLRATLLSQAGERYRYVERDFKRELDEKGHKVRSEEVRTDTTVRARPYVTLPARRLVDEGFVSGRVEAGRTYYAPDVETLLSEPFVETHCIEVSGDREVDGERWVGLAFRPVDGRSLPDVQGTLWLTANGAELRAMEFRYVNVAVPVAPRRRRDEGIPGGMLPTTREMSLDDLGGRLAFTRLPSGRWIIKDWTLTLPRVGATRAWWNPNQQFAYVLAGLHQEGGQVLEVGDDASNVLFSHRRAALAGFVADSTRGAPLAGAVVGLEGTPYADTTDADGAFRIADLPEGTYTVSFSHPRLDSLGVEAPERVVRLAEGSVASVELAVPRPAPQRLASGCPPVSGTGSATANLVGVLRDEVTGVPLPFATLILVRHPGALRAGAEGRSFSPSDLLAQGRTNAEGAFHLCGVPAGRGMGLSIRFPGRPPATLRVDLPAGTTVREDVPVPATAPAGISGRVISGEDGRPIAGADVRVGGEGGGETTTGGDGAFQVDGVTAGSHEVVVEREGYGPAVDTVSLAGGEVLRLEVRLPTHPVAAPPIQVVVMSPTPARGLSRRSRRLYELTTEEIDAELERVASTADLLRKLDVPGLLVEPVGGPVSPTGSTPLTAAEALPAGEGLCVSTTRGHGDLSPSGLGANRGCRMVKVYVDDAPLTEQMAFTYLQSLDPNTIARIQFVPAVDAGARYGTGSQNGVLLIYTRAGERRSGTGGG